MVGSATGSTRDADGNLTVDSENDYFWDAENRLIKVTPIGSSTATTYRYDGLNRRAADITSSGSETDYLWCGTQICEAYTPTGTITGRYILQGEAHYSGSTDIAMSA